MSSDPTAAAAAVKRKPIWRRRWLATLLAVLAVAALLLLVAVLEGDLPADLTNVRAFARTALRRYGAGGALGLLYLEESGIPLPVPGDVYVAYLGRLAGGDVGRWLAAWVAIVVVVVAGASNLYLVSRRWGTRLLEHGIAAALDLEPARIAAAERWFARWGAAVIIFGRHIPGLRVPITVAAGVSRVSYPVFAGSVAISSAAWAALWLWLGGRYGSALGRFFGHHAWTYLVVVALILLVVAAAIVRGWRRSAARARSRRGVSPPAGG